MGEDLLDFVDRAALQHWLTQN
ncbi:hypothetical protein [Candidatus Cyanaurora vandensis]